MLRTGDQYLDALRDGRVVYLGGERVPDVTVHPAFRNTARTLAAMYDYKVVHREAMCFEEDGEWYSNWYLVPRSQDDLRRRAEAHRRIARLSHGLLGRSMDHVASYMSGLRMRPDLLDSNRQGSGSNFVEYFDYLKKNDLFSSYLILTPPGARPKTSGSRADDPAPMLEVLSHDADGVVVSGIKTLGTSAVFADEAWLGNVLPLAEHQKELALTFAVEINRPGVELWVRKSIEQRADDGIEGYFSSRFDESDAVLVLKEVKVPWSRIFVLDDPALSRDIYFKTPAHTMGNHQSAIRFTEKMRLLNGIAHKAAEVNGVIAIPAVQQTLGRLAAMESALLALVEGQISQHERMVPGYVNVNRSFVYASMQWSTHNYYQVAETVRDLFGAAPFQMPADNSFADHPALRATFDRYWLSAGASAMDRYSFMKMVWDLLGSDFGARQNHYERFYGGPAHMNEMYNFWTFDWNDRRAVVDDILDRFPFPNASREAAE